MDSSIKCRSWCLSPTISLDGVMVICRSDAFLSGGVVMYRLTSVLRLFDRMIVIYENMLFIKIEN